MNEVAEDGGLALQFAQEALGHVDLANGHTVGSTRAAAQRAHERAS